MMTNITLLTETMHSSGGWLKGEKNTRTHTMFSMYVIEDKSFPPNPCSYAGAFERDKKNSSRMVWIKAFDSRKNNKTNALLKKAKIVKSHLDDPCRQK